MARPAKVWYRSDIGWWMVTIAGKKTRLLQGPKDQQHRELAEERYCDLRKLRRQLPEAADARVADVVEEFLSWSSINQSEDTYRGYLFYAQKLSEACGQVLVTDFKPIHVTRWVNGKKEKGEWGDTTAYNACRTAFRIFSWAFQEGILGKNPLKGMSRPRPKPRDRALTDDEFRAMLRCSRPYFRRLLLALRLTGARPKELRTLRWSQVREDRLVLSEHKTVKKTRKPRVIYLTAVMQKMLAWLKRHSHSDHVFLNSEGLPWTMNAVRLQVMRLKAKLGLKDDVCAYLIRHQWGTQAILNGTNPSVVAELMGNSLEMVSSVYVHLAEQHSRLQQEMEQATRASTPRPTSQRRGA